MRHYNGRGSFEYRRKRESDENIETEEKRKSSTSTRRTTCEKKRATLADTDPAKIAKKQQQQADAKAWSEIAAAKALHGDTMDKVSSVKVSIASDPSWQMWTTTTTCDKMEVQLKTPEELKVKDSFYQNCLAFDLKAFREIYSGQSLQTKVANKLPAFKAAVQTVNTEVQMLLAMHQARLAAGKKAEETEPEAKKLAGGEKGTQATPADGPQKKKGGKQH